MRKNINKNIENLAKIRGWMLDIIYNSCDGDIKEIFGKNIADELKILEKKETRFVRNLDK